MHLLSLVADRLWLVNAGSVAPYDGDPFEYTSHAIGTIIEGVRVSDTVK